MAVSSSSTYAYQTIVLPPPIAGSNQPVLILGGIESARQTKSTGAVLVTKNNDEVNAAQADDKTALLPHNTATVVVSPTPEVKTETIVVKVAPSPNAQATVPTTVPPPIPSQTQQLRIQKVEAATSPHQEKRIIVARPNEGEQHLDAIFEPPRSTQPKGPEQARHNPDRHNPDQHNPDRQEPRRDTASDSRDRGPRDDRQGDRRQEAGPDRRPQDRGHDHIQDRGHDRGQDRGHDRGPGPGDRGPGDRAPGGRDQGPDNRGLDHSRGPDHVRGPQNQGPQNRGTQNRGPDVRNTGNRFSDAVPHNLGPQLSEVRGFEHGSEGRRTAADRVFEWRHQSDQKDSMPGMSQFQRPNIGPPGMDARMSMQGMSPDKVLESPVFKKILSLMEENFQLRTQLKVQQVEAEARNRIRELETQLQMKKVAEANAKVNIGGPGTAKTATVTVVGEKLESADGQPKHIEVRVVEHEGHGKVVADKSDSKQKQPSKSSPEAAAEKEMMARKINELEHRSRALEARVKELTEKSQESKQQSQSKKEKEKK